MTYLLNVVNTYRVPTVEDALALRDKLQNTPNCELVNFLIFNNSNNNFKKNI